MNLEESAGEEQRGLSSGGGKDNLEETRVHGFGLLCVCVCVSVSRGDSGGGAKRVQLRKENPKKGQ